MLKKYLTFIFMVYFMFLSDFNLFSDQNKKEEEIFKTKDSQFGEIIEVVGSVPILKTVQSVSVTDKKDFLATGAKNLKEVLGLVSGLFTLSTGQSGQATSTFIRGSKSTQILYIIDDVKVRDFVNIGGLNLNILSPSILNKVEIVKGPLSNIYGSDAQGGVISINTLSEKKLLFSGSYGSHNSYSGDISLYKNFNNLNLFFSMNSTRNSNNIVNDVFKNSGISAKAEFKKQNLNIGFRYFGSFTDSGVPFTWDLKSSPDTSYKQNYNILAIPVKIKFSKKTVLKISSSYVKSDYSFSDPDAFFNFHSKLLSNSYTFETSLKTILNKYLTISSGIEYSGFNATNETDSNFLINNYKSNNFSAFINGNVNLNNLLIFISARFDKYKDVNSNISPQVGFSYLINNKIKLRGSYSNSFKTPLITQQINPWGVENFNLKPETADSFEIGLDYYSKFISMELTYFDSSYKNMIDWVTVDMTTFAGQYQNISNVDIKGTEIAANITPFFGLSIRGSYTYLNTEDLATGDPLLRRPKHTISGLIIYRHKLFSTSLQMVYVGKRTDSDPLSWPPLTESPSFNIFNFNLSVPINENLLITGKITNALNTEYAEIFGYQSPKRRIEVGFKFTLQ